MTFGLPELPRLCLLLPVVLVVQLHDLWAP